MFRCLKLGISTKCRQNKGEKGFSLVEVLVAIGLLGVIAVPFLMALATAFKAGSTADSQSVAMSLAQSQVEYLKSQPYASPTPATNGESIYTKISGASIPTGYSIESYNRAGTNTTSIVGVPWDSGNNQDPPTPLNTPSANDTGLEKITIIIKQGNNTILTLETYKR